MSENVGSTSRHKKRTAGSGGGIPASKASTQPPAPPRVDLASDRYGDQEQVDRVGASDLSGGSAPAISHSRSDEVRAILNDALTRGLDGVFDVGEDGNSPRHQLLRELFISLEIARAFPAELRPVVQEFVESRQVPNAVRQFLLDAVGFGEPPADGAEPRRFLLPGAALGQSRLKPDEIMGRLRSKQHSPLDADDSSVIAFFRSQSGQELIENGHTNQLNSVVLIELLSRAAELGIPLKELPLNIPFASLPDGVLAARRVGPTAGIGPPAERGSQYPSQAISPDRWMTCFDEQCLGQPPIVRVTEPVEPPRLGPGGFIYPEDVHKLLEISDADLQQLPVNWNDIINGGRGTESIYLAIQVLDRAQALGLAAQNPHYLTEIRNSGWIPSHKSEHWPDTARSIARMAIRGGGANNEEVKKWLSEWFGDRDVFKAVESLYVESVAFQPLSYRGPWGRGGPLGSRDFASRTSWDDALFSGNRGKIHAGQISDESLKSWGEIDINFVTSRLLGNVRSGASGRVYGSKEKQILLDVCARMAELDVPEVRDLFVRTLTTTGIPTSLNGSDLLPDWVRICHAVGLPVQQVFGGDRNFQIEETKAKYVSERGFAADLAQFDPSETSPKTSAALKRVLGEDGRESFSTIVDAALKALSNGTLQPIEPKLGRVGVVTDAWPENMGVQAILLGLFFNLPEDQLEKTLKYGGKFDVRKVVSKTSDVREVYAKKWAAVGSGLLRLDPAYREYVLADLLVGEHPEQKLASVLARFDLTTHTWTNPENIERFWKIHANNPVGAAKAILDFVVTTRGNEGGWSEQEVNLLQSVAHKFEEGVLDPRTPLIAFSESSATELAMFQRVQMDPDSIYELDGEAREDRLDDIYRVASGMHWEGKSAVELLDMLERCYRKEVYAGGISLEDAAAELFINNASEEAVPVIAGAEPSRVDGVGIQNWLSDFADTFAQNRQALVAPISTPMLSGPEVQPVDRANDDRIVVIAGIKVPVNDSPTGRHLVPRASQADMVMTPTAEENLKRISVGLLSKRALVLEGPTSTGKTAALLYWAWKTETPVMRVNVSGDTEPDDLLGRYVMNDEGQPEWQDGPVVQAMKNGWLLMIDEMDVARPTTMAALHSVFDSRTVTLPSHGNEVVTSDPRFRLAGTMNGVHAGRAPQSKALKSRVTELYLPEYDQTDIQRILFDRYGQDVPLEQLGQLAAAHISLSRLANEREIGGRERVAFTVRNLSRVCDRMVRYGAVPGQTLSPAELLRREIGEVYGARLINPKDRQTVNDMLDIVTGTNADFYGYLRPPEDLGDAWRIGDLLIPKLDIDSPLVPTRQAAEPIFTPRIMRLFYQIGKALESKENVSLIGDRSAGKTMLAGYYAFARGQPFHLQSYSSTTDVSDVIGRYGLQGWEDGMALQALGEHQPPGVYCADEWRTAHPGVQARLNSVTDDARAFNLPEKNGAVVRVHPEARIIITGNPATPDYPESKKMSVAEGNRFTEIFCDPILADEGLQILLGLSQRSPLPQNKATQIVTALSSLQERVVAGYANQTLGYGMRPAALPEYSFRTLENAWDTVVTLYTTQGYDAYESYQTAVEQYYTSGPLNAADKRAIREWSIEEARAANARFRS